MPPNSHSEGADVIVMDSSQQQHRQRQSEAQSLRRPAKLSPGKAALYAQLWENKFQELKTFRRIHGHCDPKVAGETKLASWVYAQKRNRREGKLGPDRVARLDELGFNWDVRKTGLNELKWENHFSELKKFKSATGHCNVSREDDEGEYIPLGDWLWSQRKLQRAGILDLGRRARLEELGVRFESKEDRNDRLWNEKFERLEAYRARFGDCLVPGNFADDKQLGIWVGSQRKNYNNGSLRSDRIEKLDGIGFEWRVKAASLHRRDDSVRELKFEVMYEKLREFYAEHGHSLVVTTGKNQLGNWVSRQRFKYAHGLLEAQRIERLDELDFVWRVDHADAERSPAVQQKRWDEMLTRLVAFKASEGHARVPVPYAPDAELESWLRTQRYRHKRGTLDARRKEKLDSVGFEWEATNCTQGLRWSRMLQRLVDHHEKTGSFEVRHSQDATLAQWIRTQRSGHARNQILADRKARLDAIGFPWATNSRVARMKRKAKNAESDDDSFCELIEDSTQGIRFASTRKLKNSESDDNSFCESIEDSTEGMRSARSKRKTKNSESCDDRYCESIEDSTEGMRFARKKRKVKKNAESDDDSLCESIEDSTEEMRFARKKEAKRAESNADGHGICKSSEDSTDGPVGTTARKYFDVEVVTYDDAGVLQVRYQLDDEEKDHEEAEPKERDARRRGSSQNVPSPIRSSETVVPWERRLKQEDNDAAGSTFAGDSTRVTEIEYAVGTRVEKYFKGHGWLGGKVIQYSDPYYKIRYEHGEVEECDLGKLRAILLA